jgi:hypothetical protein
VAESRASKVIRSIYTIIQKSLKFLRYFGSINTRHINIARSEGTDGSIILKWILKEKGVRLWTGLIWPKIRIRGVLL